MAKKAETFVMETEVLNKAQEFTAHPNPSIDEVKDAYKTLIEEYSKLLDEAKFLTKISDKLEAKLNKANEELKDNNQVLAHDAEEAREQKDRVLSKNKQLFQEKTEQTVRTNKIQLVMIILLAAVVVLFIFIIYKLYFEPLLNGQQPDIKIF